MTASKPPVARREPKVIEQLGRTRTDDYAWMKDDNWREVLRDPKVLRADIREHLDAENAYTKELLAGTEALQAQLFAEMKGRIKEDDSSVPASDGAWDYYVRYEIGAEHPVHGRRPRGRDDGEVVLLDEVALAKEYEQDGRVLILAPESLYGQNTLSRSFEGLERMYRAGYAAAEAIPAFLES